MDWKLTLKGGAFDGSIDADLRGMAVTEPQPVLVAWRCADDPDCEGHFTFNPAFPGIELSSAIAYRRTDLRPSQREADYEVGQGDPADEEQREEREVVGAGAGYTPFAGGSS
jgi:hypothetical protein